MQLQEPTTITPGLEKELLDVWERSIKATHHFLTPTEIAQIKAYVPQALEQVQHLVVGYDHQRVVGFIGSSGRKVDLLFVDSRARGNGYGRQLLQSAIRNYAVDDLTVNEQNPQAIGFYQHLGFRTVARLATDDQGQPYPILRMRRLGREFEANVDSHC